MPADDWSWFESALDAWVQRAGTAFAASGRPAADAPSTGADTVHLEMTAQPGAALVDVSGLLAVDGPFAVGDAVTDDRIAELLAELTAGRLDARRRGRSPATLTLHRLRGRRPP